MLYLEDFTPGQEIDVNGGAKLVHPGGAKLVVRHRGYDSLG